MSSLEQTAHTAIELLYYPLPNHARPQFHPQFVPTHLLMLPNLQSRHIHPSQSPIESAHSRFPIINNEQHKILGVILAKDLLGYFAVEKKSEFNYKQYLRASFKDCSNSSLERSGMWKNRFFNLCKKDNVEVGCSSFI
jgi:hypothetical protein